MVGVSDFHLHPLGFYYLQAHSSATGACRIHVWLNESRSYAHKIHSHSFDIESRVVSGGLKSDIFEFVQQTNGKYFEYAVTYEGDKSELIPTQRRGDLVRCCTFISTEGDKYFLRAGLVHEVSTVRVPCITVFTSIERGADIRSYGDERPEIPFVRRPVNPQEIERLREVLVHMEDRDLAEILIDC